MGYKIFCFFRNIMHTMVCCLGSHQIIEAIMSLYNPASKEAILYYAQVMAGSWGYKPAVYAKRMGWLDSDEKVTIDGQKIAKWIFESEPEF